MDSAAAFEPFPKIARLNRDCVITEKIDGTNAAVVITPVGAFVNPKPAGVIGVVELEGERFYIQAQSRKKFVTPGKSTDNFGFAAWVEANAAALVDVLGAGRHFGEWWGQGIQRGYGLDHKRLSLFNTQAWAGVDTHWGLGVVPVLYEGPFNSQMVNEWLGFLREYGSQAAPGFADPEGLVVWHEAARQLFKVTVKDDEKPKGLVA